MVDAHCHIDLYPNPHKICEETENANIKTIAVTNLPSHFEIGYPHISRYKNIRLALGFHPLYSQNNEFEMQVFKRNINKTSYIGEIGLDFSKKDKYNTNDQIERFDYIIRHVSREPKYITIHSRKAEKTTLDILDNYNVQPCVFHWYTGPLSLIDKIANSGHFFSVNPAMIKSKHGTDIIKRIPRSRILTETDGPFVKSNGKPIHPKHVKSILTCLACTWNIEIEEVQAQIYSNFKRILTPINGIDKLKT